MDNSKKFINDVEKTEDIPKGGNYGFCRAPKYLKVWSALFQKVISQAGSFIASGEFHNRECGIYKAEGGCSIQGGGELVLCDSSCYFDYRCGENNTLIKKMADLITDVVLAWDPMDPIESMLKTAAQTAKCDVEKLREAIFNGGSGGPFGGDPLSSFFGWNYNRTEDDNRDYIRFCLVNFNNLSEAEVDQKFADQDLGKELFAKLQKHIQAQAKAASRDWPKHSIYSCSPRRFQKDNSLHFWINTGCNTQLDGWKTEKEIKDFIASGEELKDPSRKY